MEEENKALEIDIYIIKEELEEYDITSPFRAAIEKILDYTHKLEVENTELRKRIDEIAIAGLRMSNY